MEEPEVIAKWMTKIAEYITSVVNTVISILDNFSFTLNQIKENLDKSTRYSDKMVMDVKEMSWDLKKAERLLGEAISGYDEEMEVYLTFATNIPSHAPAITQGEKQFYSLKNDIKEVKIELDILLTNCSNEIYSYKAQNNDDASMVRDSFKNKLKEMIDKISLFKMQQKERLEFRKERLRRYFDVTTDQWRKIEKDSNTIKNIIWFDPSVMNEENSKYQIQLRNSFPKCNFYAFDNLDNCKIFIKTLQTRTILISCGKKHKELFDRCYFEKQLTDMMIFASKLTLYADAKTKYPRIFRIVDKIESLVESINDIFNDDTFDWVIPLEKVNQKVLKYNNSFVFKNFSEISKEPREYYRLVNKAVELKIADKLKAEKEVHKFIMALRNPLDKLRTAKAIIHLYTCESLFYKLVNQVLRDMREENIKACQVWIKALNLALKTVGSPSNMETITLYRSIRDKDLNVNETYKEESLICFPAFTSTTTNIEVAKNFGARVMFEINYKFSLQKSSQVYRISEYSKFRNEDEYLFSCFSVFFVSQIEKLENDCFKIILTNDLS